MPNPSRIETLEQARETLAAMDDGQEIIAGAGDSGVAITKHGEYEFTASLEDLETGIISLRDASYILIEHGSGEEVRFG